MTCVSILSSVYWRLANISYWMVFYATLRFVVLFIIVNMLLVPIFLLFSLKKEDTPGEWMTHVRRLAEEKGSKRKRWVKKEQLGESREGYPRGSEGFLQYHLQPHASSNDPQDR